MDIKEELHLKKEARRVYLWLLFSPVLTVPCLGWNALSLSFRADFLEKAWALAVPLVFHLVLLPWLLSPKLFVKRHAQQGLFLVGLRYLSALLFLGVDLNLDWFVLVNTGLVVLGYLIGMSQVGRGASSLMVLLGEEGLLPGSSSNAGLTQAAGEAKPALAPRRAASRQAAGPAEKLRLGRRALIEEKPKLAAGCFSEAFRDGDHETRQEALSMLELMGEVEVF